MPEAVFEDVAISWEEAGAEGGQPVLVVHGFGSHRTANWLDAGWDRAFTDAGIRAVLVDLPGHGASGRPVGSEHYTVDRLVEGLVAVLDAAGLERVGYLGYSFGSRLGWELALAHPDRLARLVLGGLSLEDPLSSLDVDAARAFAAAGAPIADPPTEALMRMASLVPGNDLERLVDVAVGARASALPPLSAERAPAVPVLTVSGERDELAAGVAQLAEAIGARHIELPVRSHSSAVTARAFKEAAVGFLAGR